MAHIPIRTEKGFTLIEVIAAIVLISIILLSFTGVFVQANKTRVASEQLVDATYYAQQEMEEIYALSQTSTFESIIDSAGNPSVSGYNPITADCPLSSNNALCIQNSNYSPYTIKIQFLRIDSDLYSVIIDVEEPGHDGEAVLKSRMENVYIWGGS